MSDRQKTATNEAMDGKNYVCVIGGSTVDVYGCARSHFMYGDSNPGDVHISYGGVGRNMAENLSRLGVRTEFLTLFGNDQHANSIIEICKKNNVGISHSEKCDDCNSSFYICIEDSTGDMCAGISDMKLYDKLTSDFIEKRLDIINNSDLCVIDTNLKIEVLEYISRNVKVPIFVDPVSTAKSKKLINCMDNIHTVKANLIEAECLSEMHIDNHKDLRAAARHIIQKGVKQLFITLGNKGVYYNNVVSEGLLEAPKSKVKSTTGAGDAFFAGALWAYGHNKDIREMAQYGQSAASILIKSGTTFSNNLNIQNLQIERGNMA